MGVQWWYGREVLPPTLFKIKYVGFNVIVISMSLHHSIILVSGWICWQMATGENRIESVHAQWTIKIHITLQNRKGIGNVYFPEKQGRRREQSDTESKVEKKFSENKSLWNIRKSCVSNVMCHDWSFKQTETDQQAMDLNPLQPTYISQRLRYWRICQGFKGRQIKAGYRSTIDAGPEEREGQGGWRTDTVKTGSGRYIYVITQYNADLDGFITMKTIDKAIWKEERQEYCS